MSGYWSAASKAVGGWDLQEQGGVIANDSVGGRNGDLLNGLSFTSDATAGPTGWLPSALTFTASDHAVEIAYDGALNGTAYSTRAWAKWDGSSGAYGAVWSCRSSTPTRSGHLLYKSNGDDWEHWFGSSGAVWNAYGDEPCATDWVFLATTFDGVASRLYVDGVEVSSRSGGNYTPNSVVPWVIGNLSSYGAGFGGAIAGFAVYDEALTGGEVAELFAGPEPTVVTAPEVTSSVAVGEALEFDPGDWNGHGNGTVTLQPSVQQSDDGVAGWSPAPAPLGDPGATIPPSLVGKYLRIAVTANNSGGPSDPAVSTAYYVEMARSPVRVAAFTIDADRASSRQATLAGATTGVVLPREAA